MVILVDKENYVAMRDIWKACDLVPYDILDILVSHKSQCSRNRQLRTG